MKPRKGVMKKRKTWLEKGLTSLYKGVNEKSRGLDTRNEFHYIRPTNSEVDMAEQEPLRPYCKSKLEDSNSGGDSTMVLRPRRDAPLEVEKKNYGVYKRYENLLFTYSP